MVLFIMALILRLLVEFWKVISDKEIIMVVLEIIQSLAIIAASIVAFFGINSWRKEMKEKKEYTLAEEVLALFYEAQDKINAIRNPFSLEGEGRSRKADPSETPKQKEILDQAYVFIERYNNNSEVLNKLRTIRYRFMVLFGKNQAKLY